MGINEERISQIENYIGKLLYCNFPLSPYFVCYYNTPWLYYIIIVLNWLVHYIHFPFHLIWDQIPQVANKVPISSKYTNSASQLSNRRLISSIFITVTATSPSVGTWNKYLENVAIGCLRKIWEEIVINSTHFSWLQKAAQSLGLSCSGWKRKKNCHIYLKMKWF